MPMFSPLQHVTRIHEGSRLRLSPKRRTQALFLPGTLMINALHPQPSTRGSRPSWEISHARTHMPGSIILIHHTHSTSRYAYPARQHIPCCRFQPKPSTLHIPKAPESMPTVATKNQVVHLEAQGSHSRLAAAPTTQFQHRGQLESRAHTWLRVQS